MRMPLAADCRRTLIVVHPSRPPRFIPRPPPETCRPQASRGPLPARERINGPLRGKLRRIDRHVARVLDLQNQHRVLVLVRIPVVALELHLAHDAVPAAGSERGTDLLPI